MNDRVGPAGKGKVSVQKPRQKTQEGVLVVRTRHNKGLYKVSKLKEEITEKNKKEASEDKKEAMWTCIKSVAKIFRGIPKLFEKKSAKKLIAAAAAATATEEHTIKVIGKTGQGLRIINPLLFNDVKKRFGQTFKSFVKELRVQRRKTEKKIDKLEKDFKALSLEEDSTEYKEALKQYEEALKKIKRDLLDYTVDYVVELAGDATSLSLVTMGIADIVVDIIKEVPLAIETAKPTVLLSTAMVTTSTVLGYIGLGLAILGWGYEVKGYYKNAKFRKEIDGILGVTAKYKTFDEGYNRKKIKKLLEHFKEIHEANPRELKHRGMSRRFIEYLEDGEGGVPKILESLDSTNIGERELGYFKATILIENLRTRLGAKKNFRVTSAIVGAVGLVILGIVVSPLVLGPTATVVIKGGFAIFLALAAIATLIYRKTALRDPINPARVRRIHKDIKHYDIFEQHVYGKYEIPQKIEELQESEKAHKKRIKELRAKGIQSRRDQVTEQRLDTKLKQIDEEIRYLVNMKGELYPLSYKV
ncbi:MAG: hypothetical protein HN411_04855 [Waddliaceae bacterium]|nr:hypothetical protein [Waddliaceae bacterium]